MIKWNEKSEILQLLLYIIEYICIVWVWLYNFLYGENMKTQFNHFSRLEKEGLLQEAQHLTVGIKGVDYKELIRNAIKSAVQDARASGVDDITYKEVLLQIEHQVNESDFRDCVREQEKFDDDEQLMSLEETTRNNPDSLFYDEPLL